MQEAEAKSGRKKAVICDVILIVLEKTMHYSTVREKGWPRKMAVQKGKERREQGRYIYVSRICERRQKGKPGGLSPGENSLVHGQKAYAKAVTKDVSRTRNYFWAVVVMDFIISSP